jgi:glycerol-3-phosphate O-acyltransferase
VISLFLGKGPEKEKEAAAKLHEDNAIPSTSETVVVGQECKVRVDDPILQLSPINFQKPPKSYAEYKGSSVAFVMHDIFRRSRTIPSGSFRFII